MRPLLILTLMMALSLVGCGADETQTDLSPPVVDEGPGSQAGQMPGGQHDMGINTDITMSEEVIAAWRGAIIEVAGPEDEPMRFDLPFNQLVPLGDTGLSAAALAFVPDFVMGEDGITTRSAEAANPALRIRVIEEGRPEYEGWLFAAMPEIHPFPHETYSILLVDGLPAE